MLELEGISRRFGDVVALDDVSFRVPDGSITGFVGANGAGKTTAMRIIMGVERADAGVVRWNGSTHGAGTRRRFGYMPEERGLYPKMRAHDQLTYLAELHGIPRGEAVATASTWLDRFGLGERAQDAVEKLSLGNQQRVQLAAALVHDPELLVLDEPFSGLDPVGTDALAVVLRDTADRGVPILFSSHQLELVERLCDAVAIIDQGRVLASGDVGRLRRGDDRVLRVEVRGAGTDWADGLPDVEVLHRERDAVLIRLGPDTDDQRVLAAAQAVGPIAAFAEDTPTLADRYREVVTA